MSALSELAELEKLAEALYAAAVQVSDSLQTSPAGDHVTYIGSMNDKDDLVQVLEHYRYSKFHQRKLRSALMPRPSPTDQPGVPGCPFCGAAPVLEPSSIDEDRWTASCDNMGCPAHPIVVIGRGRDGALAVWNRRADGAAECCRGLAPKSECPCDIQARRS